MKQQQKGPAVIGLLLLFLIISTQIAIAAETVTVSSPNSEVIFLLDTSGSMKTQDKERLALDAIRQAAYGLPSNYEVGFVAYGTNIQAVIPLDTDITKLDTQLSATQYTGYTNAGAGLSQAMGLFSEEEETNRYIVLLTDGEIDMPDGQAREASRKLYEESARWAKDRGVKIYISAIGSELNNPQMHIFDAAEITDGAIYWEGASGSLSQIMSRIAEDRFDFPGQAIDAAKGGSGNLRIEIPTGASRMKLILHSDAGISNVTADYEAAAGRTVNGQRFAVVDMNAPTSDTVDISVQCPDPFSVLAYQTVEYTVRPQTVVTYRSEEVPRTEEEIRKQLPPVYEHFADIVIQMIDTVGNNENIWKTESDEGREINYTINGAAYKGLLQDGQISNTIPADGVEQVEVHIETSGIDDAIYFVEQPVVEQIKKYPDPVFEPEPDYRPLWMILGLLGAAILALLFWWVRKSKTTVIYMAQPLTQGDSPKKIETKACTYSGKFNLYVVRNKDGRDMAPQTYRLFGRGGGRVTLNQILNSCGIKFGKIGAEDIIFYPGPENAVIIMDQSEGCTVLRGAEILKKGMGYPAYYNEKLTITFEDEATEMELHYKNLKPSERESM